MSDGRPLSRGVVLWEPTIDQIWSSRLHAFLQTLNARLDRNFTDYDSFYRFSVDEPALFWPALWEFLPIIGDGPGTEGLGKIAPWRARSHDPQHAFNKHPIVAPRRALLVGTAYD